MNKIIYFTKSGNSKIMANGLSEVLNIEAINILDKPIIKNIETLIVVSAIYKFQDSPEMRAFIDTFEKDSVNNAIIITLSASGFMSQKKIIEMFHKKEIRTLGEKTFKSSFLMINKNRPNSGDIDNAKDFIINIIKN